MNFWGHLVISSWFIKNKCAHYSVCYRQVWTTAWSDSSQLLPQWRGKLMHLHRSCEMQSEIYTKQKRGMLIEEGHGLILVMNWIYISGTENWLMQKNRGDMRYSPQGCSLHCGCFLKRVMDWSSQRWCIMYTSFCKSADAWKDMGYEISTRIVNVIGLLPALHSHPWTVHIFIWNISVESFLFFHTRCENPTLFYHFHIGWSVPSCG